MSNDIGVVSGLIELTDNFTSELGLAEAALVRFTKQNQESLIAVAGAVGVVAAAYGLAAAAVINLGQRGADVNDVQEALEHFSGGAREAEANLAALRDGVKGTLDDFVLMKDASKLLSANVKLTAEDFNTLGSASFVLQNRGLGSTKEMLELVSDALVTGRTRALAMAVGVVDAGNAEEEYAKTLGTTADKLTDRGKAEAHRIEVMRLLNAAVKDAGVQELDFGEKLEAAKAAASNYVDAIASAIAKSPALAAGFEVIKDAVSDAFGGSQQTAIDTTMNLIKQGAMIAVDFGIATVEMARVVNVAWSAIKTIILGTETVVVGVADAVAGAIALVTGAAAALPGATDGMKLMAAQAKATSDNLHEMTLSLAAQTAEAASGLVGHSEFDKTLDKLGGTLFRVRDAIDGADASMKKNNETTDVAHNNALKIANVQKQLQQSMVDRQKIEDELWKVEKKSLEETTILWDKYFAERTKNTGSSFDAARAEIEAWRDDEIAKLDDSDKNWQLHYEAINAVADEKLKGIASDWNSVKDISISALIEQRDAAAKTYADMASSGNFFRADVDAQRKKVEDLNETIRDGGKAAQDAQAASAAAMKKMKDDADAIAAAAKKAADEMRRMGGSFDVTSENFARVFHDINTAGGANPTGTMSEADAQRLARLGYSLQEILAMIGNHQQLGSNLPPPRGPRIPGFADGGIVDIAVGERGPETVRVPLGSTVFPNGMQLGGGGAIENHITVTLDGRVVHRSVANRTMRDAKTTRKFQSAT